ncbi:MAG: helix-turn-helix domain-containing protein [Ferruginibacter sp.]
MRIGYACKLLLQEKLNISEICYECGYGNISNFNRHFKALMHVTPSEYHYSFDATIQEKYVA